MFIFLFATVSKASEDFNSAIPPKAMDGIDYLLEFITTDSTDNIDILRLDDLIEFVGTHHPDDVQIKLPKRLRATAAYYEFDIQRQFDDIISLTYHPDIPLQMVSPGSVRLSYWIDENGKKLRLPLLLGQLETITSPIVIKGVENEVITPDMTTGAYYRSLLDRALILFTKDGRRILISLAKQKQISDVGKKGLIIGADENWDYFFSEEKGLTKTGLGWVDSHIYDTFSVVVYHESDQFTRSTKCSLFKWLRAGWAKMNMVKPKHIRAGFKRFSRDVTRVIESPNLPDIDKLAYISNNFNQLSDNALRIKMQAYLEHFTRRINDEHQSSHQVITRAATNGYISRLKPDEIRATLFLEALKYHLGILTKNDIAYLGLPDL